MKSSFSFTNTELRTVKLPVVNIDPEVYSPLGDEPTDYQMSNSTTSTDQPELITYQCGKMTKTPLSSEMENLHPAPVQSAEQYGIKIEELLRVTDDNGNLLYDVPITACLTFKHSRDAAVTSSVIETVLQRLIGALYKSETETRINDMMRFSIRPR